MKIEGYVICCPISWNEQGDPDFMPREHTFGKTPTEAWIRFMDIRPDDNEWDRKITHWVKCGYCPKHATLEVTW